MFDSKRSVCELTTQAIASPFVASWPGEIVSDHLQVQVLSIAAVCSGEPWP